MYVAQHSLAQQVRFLGEVSDVPSLLHASDIFVLPSFSEGMPNVLLEAMACALPCIASDIPGVRELLESDVNGALFAPGDFQALASYLEGLLTAPDEHQRLGQQARQMTETQFSIEQTVRNYENLFEELGRRRAGAPHG